MISQDFILLIMNCRKYESKAAYQRRTWLLELPNFIKYYHVIGDETLDTEYSFDEEKHILTLKIADDYVSLPKKVISAYEAVSQTYTYKYIWKTDDDQFMHSPSKFFHVLKNILLTKKPETHYGGFIVNNSHAYMSEYYIIHPELPKNLPLFPTKYCSGRFYFLSAQAVDYLITKKKYIQSEYFEDYAIGYYLHDVFKVTMMNIQTHEHFKDFTELER